MAITYALSNYHAIKRDKHGKDFLEYSLDVLSSKYNLRRTYVFVRCLLVGFSADSVYGPFYQAEKEKYISTKGKDKSFDRSVFESSLSGLLVDNSVASDIDGFSEYLVGRMCKKFGSYRQYVISRYVLSGLASDTLFGPLFGWLKESYSDSNSGEAVVASKKFINDVLGDF